MAAVLYCGVDVALQTNWARFIDAVGDECRKRFSFANDANGATSFLREVHKTLLQGDFDEVRIGIEATNFLSWHLAMLLTKWNELAAFRPKVYMFNPKVVRNFRNNYPDWRKDDWFDARVIADRVRFGHPLLRPSTQMIAICRYNAGHGTVAILSSSWCGRRTTSSPTCS